MRFILLLVTVFTLSISSTPSYALSCAPPVLDQAAVEKADMIFLGKVLRAGEKPTRDNARMPLWQKFEFSIDKLWKGDIDPTSVMISRDIYWGDTFTVGDEYLVVAREQDGDYATDLCGPTTHTSNDAAKERIEFLNQYFQQNVKEQEQK